ncbi:hypothetical protein DACRYDRAFT_21066 [Dacryopinax primogenitus]|uniref:Dihydroorotate dehydrogenase (quinone), mitochondrial n=1 Tax=Dacryopinax primogenitus (strain DJM 731) TaxID=1858805 RepID=M5GEQ7_DACPD|nr:uncharacterized protein DACRYDRAFT_21066 [Dacryopinax primogenitus]EJU03488.1 hypothetical protein DACRYDRAFT_21066 [Dacryopinax primogenitus]
MLRAALRRPLLSSHIHVRSANTTACSSSSPLSYVYGTLLLAGAGVFAAYYVDSRAAVHKYVAMPLVRACVDGETAHKLAVKMLATGLMPRDVKQDDELLECELWDLPLSNPLGIAAGLDKDAEAVDGLYDLGFGYVEVGSVTPEPQPGNPQPRFFRLPADRAIINRYGFNSAGHALVLLRLRTRLRNWPEVANHAQRQGRVLAVNLGKNKSSSPDSIDDYLMGVRAFGSVADVLVVNVSSPNTPGLRSLQARGMLEELLSEVVRERDALPLMGEKPRVVVKLAPDLTKAEIEDVAAAVRATKVDGVIMGNTTVQRPDGLKSPQTLVQETGGLSGQPLKPITIEAFKTLRSLLPASIPLIACGGISSGADALEYAKLGAATIQLYTAFGYDGVGTPREIKDELTELLRKEGKSWREVSREAVAQLAWKDDAESAMERLKQEAENALENLKEISTQIALGDDLAPNWIDPVLENAPPPTIPTPEPPTSVPANEQSPNVVDVLVITPDSTSKEEMDNKSVK